MKKKANGRNRSHCFYKFLLVMKISLILLLLSTSVAFSRNTYSQSVSITLSLHKVTVREVIRSIEDQTDFIFFYQDQELDLDRTVSIDIKEKKINDILDVLFQGTESVYIIKDRQIVIGKSAKKIEKGLGLLERVIPEARQQFPVTGLVKDAATGEPLPGVNIIVEGTSVGTITDADGHFSINAPSGQSSLQFSFVGYNTEKIDLNQKNMIDIFLVPDIQQLQEVVTIGYGLQKKVNLSGAVDVVNSKEIDNRPVNNVVQALQGLAPNLNITVSNEGGEVGGKMNMNIRGIGSISGTGGNPYILVDGIEQNIYNISPDDIESISVLKDAAASAIYGARAAFGVILVTTKKGKKDGTVINYSNNFSWASPINLPNSANSIDFASYFNQASANDGNAPVFIPIIIQNMKAYQAGELKEWTMPYPLYPNVWLTYQGAWANTDWFEIDYKDWVPKSTHNLSVSGGDNKTQYYFSGSLFNQEGIMSFGNDEYHRYNLNAKINTTVFDWLRFNLLSKFNKTNLERPSYNKDQFYANIARRWPTNGVYFPDGTLNSAGEQIWLQEGGRYNQGSNEFTAIPGIEIEPLKNWIIYANYRWKMNANGYSNHEAKVTSYLVDGTPFYLRPNNYYATDKYVSYYNSPNVYSSFNKIIGPHDFTIMLGYEQETVNYDESYARKDDLVSDDKPSLGTATGKEYASGDMGHWATRSYFGRFNYNYMGKYLLEISARRDGSSKFEEGYRWGTFPSGSLAYILSREAFWEPLSRYISMMKIRGSFGSLGNQDVANYLYVERLPVYTNLPYILGGVRPNYTGMAGLTSPYLTWEKVNTTNIGTDLGFLNNKLTLTFDYFIRNTYDMLGPAESLPAVLGTEVPKSNNAILKTNGFEFLITWKDNKGDFTYDATFMLSDANTEIVDYYNPQNLLSAPFYKGKKLGEIWGYTTLDLFHSDTEAQGWDQSYLSGEIWHAGDVKYADLDGDNKIDVGKNTVEDHGDLSIIGNFMPRYSYSFLFNAAWKGIDFNMIWQGVGKRDLWLSGSHFWGAYGGIWQATAFEEHLDYWTADNTDAYYPRPYLDKGSKNQQVQTRYLQDGAYLRFKSAQLGYRLPPLLTKQVFIRNLRIYVAGENLLTFTKLSKVFDPEAISGIYGDGKIYPLQRSFSFGFNVTF